MTSFRYPAFASAPRNRSSLRGPRHRGCRLALTLFSLLIAQPVLPVPLAAQELPRRFTLHPVHSRVWFDAQSSLGAFRGTAHDVVGWTQISDTITFQDARGRVEILVSSLRTGLLLRDRHLRDALQAERYPRIVFAVEGIEQPPGPGAPGSEPGNTERQVLLRGVLSIRGTSRELEIPATVAIGPESLRVRGRLPIRLTEFGIDPPSRLLGAARMRDALELAFDAVFVAIAP